jgi:hypothetical protein
MLGTVSRAEMTFLSIYQPWASSQFRTALYDNSNLVGDQGLPRLLNHWVVLLAGSVKDGKDLGYFGGLGIENPILSILVFPGKHSSLMKDLEEAVEIDLTLLYL